jgi:hypothetical protein
MNKTSNPDRYLRSFYESVALERFAIRLTMARASEMSNRRAAKGYLCARRNHSIHPFRRAL